MTTTGSRRIHHSTPTTLVILYRHFTSLSSSSTGMKNNGRGAVYVKWIFVMEIENYGIQILNYIKNACLICERKMGRIIKKQTAVEWFWGRFHSHWSYRLSLSLRVWGWVHETNHVCIVYNPFLTRGKGGIFIGTVKLTWICLSSICFFCVLITYLYFCFA